MKPTYFWKNNQVVEVNARIPAALLDGLTMWKFLYCPCVDPKNDTPQFRSGMFVSNGDGPVAKTSWHYIPFDDLPAEFKATLLLMGVP